MKEACAAEASNTGPRYDASQTLALALGSAVEKFLFETKKYSAAAKQTVVELEVYTPYRIYMHNVLPQTCGTPAALAAILSAVLSRLESKGHFPAQASLKVSSLCESEASVETPMLVRKGCGQERPARVVPIKPVSPPSTRARIMVSVLRWSGSMGVSRCMKGCVGVA